MTVARALLVERDLTRRIGTRELPQPGPEEALVAVEWAGVCGSDLHVLRTGAWVADWPATLGHEIYGRVLQGPADGTLAPGTAVVADSRIPCGSCPPCAAGDPDRCPDIAFVGEQRPGGFATHCVLPARLLHAVGDAVPGRTAVLAEPLAVALHAIGHLRRGPERAAIIGHGPIGALIHVELRRRFPGCRIDVAERAPRRRRLAEALGAACAETAQDLTAAGYDAVVDAAGYARSLEHAIALAAPGGHVLLVALGHEPVPLVPAALVERRLQLSGCHAFVDELPEALWLLAADGGRYDRVVSDVVALDDLPGALGDLLERPDPVKLVVRP